MAPWRTVEKLLLLIVLLCTLTKEATASLNITQGRIIYTPLHVELIPVVGIATVELGGSHTNRPNFYFDCTTDLNNGSGITWSRMSGDIRFELSATTNGPPGMRMSLDRIDEFPDFDVYTCSDLYSDDVVSINITALNPAIMAAEETVGVVQGLSVELEMYVSGYPVPTDSQITWYHPMEHEILDSHSGVEFQDSKRRLILSNVQPEEAGLYTCKVVLSLQPYMGATTSIQLNVYVPSTIETQPVEQINVAEWMEVTLNCSASGSPMPLIRWEREGGAQLPVGAMIASSTNGNITTSHLTFNAIRCEDRGRYRCVADNMETDLARSQYANISVYPLMLYDEEMQEVNDIHPVKEHSSVRLECYGRGALEWTSSSGLSISFDTSNNIYQSYNASRDASSLVIQNFTNATIATYTCMLDLMDVLNDPITISVLITSSNPAVIIQSQVQYVLSGSSTTLEATILASPAESAVVQWYHQGRLIDDVNEAQYTATSSGDIRRLRVDNVSSNEIGEYTIVVIVNGMNATDGIMLAFPEAPLATIVPSSISVSEGDEVMLTCEAQGSRPLTVTWTMSDGSPLLVGVQENGNTLLIASATRAHPGTYVCLLSNLAGTSRDEFLLEVFYAPLAIITYNNMNYTSEQELYLEFDDNAQGPTILCSSGGHLPPTIGWVRENGGGLPNGISQTVLLNGEVLLRWQRPIEFTDSGSYHCQASNNIANSSASLELLVKIEPTINSIYPFNSVIEQDPDTRSFTVPLNYVGRTLVCAAKGWPAPEVEWYRNGSPLDGSSGVVSEPSAMAATVSAKLMWTREFTSDDEGRYECVIRKPNTEVALTSQTVQLNAGPPAALLPPLACSIQQQSIEFQIRVLGTSCASWEGVRSEDVANELLSIVRTECNCAVGDSDLQVWGSAQCSSKIGGAAVFRGHIQTDSQLKTEQIYCSLFQWQQKTSLIGINNQLRAVDPTCSLRVNTSPNSEECSTPVDSASVFGTVEIAIIVGVAACVILISVIVVVIILAVCCCRYRRRSKQFDVNDGGSDHVYSRTGSFTRRPEGIITKSTQGIGEEPVYSTLTDPGRTANIPSYTENIPLCQFPSDSSENLIPESMVGAHLAQSLAKMKSAEAYQIPVSSQENLASPALGSINSFQAMKRFASTTSGYHTTSHMMSSTQKVSLPRTSNSSTEEGGNVLVSATSPWNDYEHVDGDDAFTPSSSFCDSPTIPEGRLQGRLQSSGSIGGGMHPSPQNSGRHNRVGMSASVPIRINPPQLGLPVFTVVEEDRDEFRTQTTGSYQVLNNGRPDMTTSSQQAHRANRDNHSPNESTASSSPHIMKQALMTQFPSVDHMASPRAGRESNCSEAPPPYSSRPSSEAVPMSSDSADSSLMDNVPFVGVDSRQRLWYQASNLSLDSSVPSSISPAPNTSSSRTGDHIKPYAVVHGEQIPYPSHKTSSTKLNNESSAVIVRRSSKDQQKSQFQVQSPVQPYAEPMRSSIASLGRAQDSPTFFEVVV